MKPVNLKALQIVPLKDSEGVPRVVYPGDTNIRCLSRATGYRLRGKSAYAVPAKKGK